MADTSVSVTPGVGASVDARSQPGGDLRQVVTIGDGDATPIAAVDAAGLHSRPGRAGTSNVTFTAATATAGGATLQAVNTNRLWWSVFNESTAILYLKLGTSPSTTSYTVQVPAGGYWEMPPGIIWTGAITGIWSAANGNARTTELTA